MFKFNRTNRDCTKLIQNHHVINRVLLSCYLISIYASKSFYPVFVKLRFRFFKSSVTQLFYWITEDLGRKLDKYIAPLKVVRIVRMPERSGLVQARLAGAEAANGQVLTFLDSHCKFNVQVGQKDVSILFSLWFHVNLTKASVFQENHS